jgi:acyl-CoA dehydrogenase
MTWDFETDPEWQKELDWAADFVLNEIEPLEFFITNVRDRTDPLVQELVVPLQNAVKERGLWACHLGPELGGPGFGQVKLALLNEILGTSPLAPGIFGSNAPDSGNSEILARFGTATQKKLYLEPLLDGSASSAFSMTEPHGGSDPKVLRTTAVLDGDEWVVNGEKWFTSNARRASFFIMFVVTEPDNPPYQRSSMLIVPAGTPGVEVVRHVGLANEGPDDGNQGYLRMTDAHVSADNLLGGRGQAFAIAQSRLGGGRVHMAMRTVGLVRRAFDMLCERVISRETQGELLGKKQMVQEMVADSWLEMEQFRLLVLRTAWKIDRYQDYKRVRADIAAVKAAGPIVLRSVASRALQLHGSLGVTNEMPFVDMLLHSFIIGIGDGPTEVHKVTLARELLSQYVPTEGLFPRRHIPALRAAAEQRYGRISERHAAVH